MWNSLVYTICLQVNATNPAVWGNKHYQLRHKSGSLLATNNGNLDNKKIWHCMDSIINNKNVKEYHNGSALGEKNGNTVPTVAVEDLLLKKCLHTSSGVR